MLTAQPDASRRSLPLPLVLLVILLLWITGCGYQPHGLGSLPAEIQRVHLAALKNGTLRPCPGAEGGQRGESTAERGRLRGGLLYGGNRRRRHPCRRGRGQFPCGTG